MGNFCNSFIMTRKPVLFPHLSNFLDKNKLEFKPKVIPTEIYSPTLISNRFMKLIGKLNLFYHMGSWNCGNWTIQLTIYQKLQIGVKSASEIWSFSKCFLVLKTLLLRPEKFLETLIQTIQFLSTWRYGNFINRMTGKVVLMAEIHYLTTHFE